MSTGMMYSVSGPVAPVLHLPSMCTRKYKQRRVKLLLRFVRFVMMPRDDVSRWNLWHEWRFTIPSSSPSIHRRTGCKMVSLWNLLAPSPAGGSVQRERARYDEFILRKFIFSPPQLKLLLPSVGCVRCFDENWILWRTMMYVRFSINCWRRFSTFSAIPANDFTENCINASSVQRFFPSARCA